MPWEEKRSQSLRPERSREPDSARQLSRPFRPQPVVILPPRASAFGLSPGLHSPDPLGRTEAERLRTEFSERVQLFCDEPLLELVAGGTPAFPGALLISISILR